MADDTACSAWLDARLEVTRASERGILGHGDLANYHTIRLDLIYVILMDIQQQTN
jgi:hypothetical protein